MRDGTLKMRIQRNKGGQNPFVTLHPVALQFLKIWRDWLETNCPADGGTARWFPGIRADDTTILNRRLAAACKELNLPTIKPKGMGRAFYVKVRRSGGVDDTQIAMELGQTTNGKLIRSTYGDPDDLYASGLFDWLPETGLPAWNILAKVTNPIPSNAGGDTYGDTSAIHQDAPTCANIRTQETVKNALPESSGRVTTHLQTHAENENPLAGQGD
jgi:hypothetical protein